MVRLYREDKARVVADRENPVQLNRYEHKRETASACTQDKGHITRKSRTMSGNAYYLATRFER